MAFHLSHKSTEENDSILAHFRKIFLVELEDLFVQVLSLVQAMKLVKLGQISLIKENVSKHKALSHGHIEKLEAQLREDVQTLPKKATEVDREELADDIDLPIEVARREDRLKALAEAKTKIAERVKERDEQSRKDYQEKLARREALRATGKKPRGKEPKAPKPAPTPKPSVDVDSMPVVATTLTQHTSDKQQVEPMLSELETLLDNFGRLEALLPDNGYFANNNIYACEKRKITPLIALGREAHHLPLEQRLMRRNLKLLTR